MININIGESLKYLLSLFDNFFHRSETLIIKLITTTLLRLLFLEKDKLLDFLRQRMQ